MDRFLFKLRASVFFRVKELSHDRSSGTTRARTTEHRKGDGRNRDHPLAKTRPHVILAPHVQDLPRAFDDLQRPQGAHRCPSRTSTCVGGSQPTGSQNTALTAKVRALLDGRFNGFFRRNIRRVFLLDADRCAVELRGPKPRIEPDGFLLEISKKFPERNEISPSSQVFPFHFHGSPARSQSLPPRVTKCIGIINNAPSCRKSGSAGTDAGQSGPVRRSMRKSRTRCRDRRYEKNGAWSRTKNICNVAISREAHVQDLQRRLNEAGQQ